MNEAALAEVGAWADSMARSASLVLVLPTEPVTLAIRALLRRRAARPRPSSAFMVSGTRISVPPAFSTSRDTTAAAAPRFIASATKPWPSVVSPLRAKNRSPLPTARLSKVTPLASNGAAIDGAERLRHFVGGPERAHDTASANSRATSASSK